MDKFCVFCGKYPINEDQEHILPQWLLKKTGKKERNINLNLFYNPLTCIPYNDFKFPACRSCNEGYGKLELKTKPIINKLLQSKDISFIEIDTLLDWFDKVRIGLRLAYTYLLEGVREYTTQYFIDDIVGNVDRALFIFNSNTTLKGLSYFGTNSPLYQSLPMCVGLRINRLFFLSLGFHHMLSKRIGFPYPISSTIDGNITKTFIADGLYHIEQPPIKSLVLPNCIAMYQPCFDKCLLSENESYNAQYIKDNCINHKQGKGNIFICINEQKTTTKDILTSHMLNSIYIHEITSFMKSFSILQLETQISLAQQYPEIINLDKSSTIYWNAQIKDNIEYAIGQIRLIKCGYWD